MLVTALLTVEIELRETMSWISAETTVAESWSLSAPPSPLTSRGGSGSANPMKAGVTASDGIAFTRSIWICAVILRDVSAGLTRSIEEKEFTSTSLLPRTLIVDITKLPWEIST